MRFLGFGGYALSGCVAVAMLTACGALPLSLSTGITRARSKRSRFRLTSSGSPSLRSELLVGG